MYCSRMLQVCERALSIEWADARYCFYGKVWIKAINKTHKRRTDNFHSIHNYAFRASRNELGKLSQKPKITGKSQKKLPSP